MFGMITKAIEKIIQGVKSLLGLKKKVVNTVERAIEIKERVYETIEVVETYKDEPVETLKRVIPNFQAKTLLVVVIILTIMYSVSLLAIFSGPSAGPVLGALLLLIVGLIKGLNDNKEESIYAFNKEE